MNFNEAFHKTVFEWEGGDRLHEVPGDPGGLTKYGISQRAHPNVNVRNLNETDAKAIYRVKYWNRLWVDNLPDELRWDVFDHGVNAGQGSAALTLQRAINMCQLVRGRPRISEDGQIGPQTTLTATGLPPLRLLRVFRALRTERYLMLARGGMEKFIEGWLDRVDGIAGNA